MRREGVGKNSRRRPWRLENVVFSGKTRPRVTFGDRLIAASNFIASFSDVP